MHRLESGAGFRVLVRVVRVRVLRRALARGDLKRLQRFQEFVSVHVHLGTGVDNVVTDNVPRPWVRVNTGLTCSELRKLFTNLTVVNASPNQTMRECCLADQLKARPDLLEALRNAIPESSKRDEDRNRRKVLKQLNSPKRPLTEEQCRWLGDAIFAFFCPQDAVILTTNI